MYANVIYVDYSEIQMFIIISMHCIMMESFICMYMYICPTMCIHIHTDKRYIHSEKNAYMCVYKYVCVYMYMYIHSSVQKRFNKRRNWPGAVARACTPSTVWEAEAGGSRGQEFETSLANMVQLRAQRNRQPRRRRQQRVE